MEEDPIFDFAPLRAFLIQQGYNVGTAQGYREIQPGDVTVDAINNGEIEFNDAGIYVVMPDGSRQQVYLYKRDYHLHLYGKPRFHICRCSTIDEFIQGGGFRDHYRRTNTSPVTVRDMDNEWNEVEVDDLPLCRNCLRLIGEYGQITSTEFAEILRQVQGEEEQETQEVDIFGYTRDWDIIRRNFKEEHDYTCERCGIHIQNPFDRHYIHCHHRDGDKLNNQETNLECLCIRCHSEIDDNHRRNFTSGANRFILQEFNEKYPIRRPRHH